MWLERLSLNEQHRTVAEPANRKNNRLSALNLGPSHRTLTTMENTYEKNACPNIEPPDLHYSSHLKSTAGPEGPTNDFLYDPREGSWSRLPAGKRRLAGGKTAGGSPP